MELTRKKIEEIIELYEMGRDVESTMFSFGMIYEEGEVE
jgi:hypothetical protein